MPLVSRKIVACEHPVAKGSGALARDQLAFDSLIEKIEAARSQFSAWEQASSLFRQKYLADLLPLLEKELDQQTRLARSLGRVCVQQDLSKAEQRKLSRLIVELAQTVLARRDDGALKVLYQQHAPAAVDADERVWQKRLRSMPAGAEDVAADEGVELPLAEQDQQPFAADSWEQYERAESLAAAHRASAKRQAHEARREAGTTRMGRSLRDVYRKMVSALHPDREPDPQERLLKTELMQRVNDAYERGNLLQLLELQLQLEHIDQTHLATLAADRRRHYIKILKGQLGELESEIRRVADELGEQFGLPPAATRHPDGIIAVLHADIARCAGSVRHLQESIEIARNPSWLKAWLKTIKPRRQFAADDPTF